MDKYRIDSHKLIYHVQRVADWLSGKTIYPVYVEIAPSGSCNHRCTYCALDFMDYRPRFLKTQILKDRLCEMATLGVKSVMYAGEGEPLLHADIGDIINYTKKVGIDVALTTNGALLNKELSKLILGNVTWIKVSINGITHKTYEKIHRAKPQDLDSVIRNMSYAVKLKRKNGYKCTLGMQIVLLPENSKEIFALAKKARQIGMDYLVVKPYSHHPFSKTTKYKNLKYSKYFKLADKLKSLNTNNFNAVFRLNTMKKWDEAKRNYKYCLALPFWSYIDSGGNLWGCSAYLGDNNFLYGNIYKNSFNEIWQGKTRNKIQQNAEINLDTRNCRVNCRMDGINRFLWELKSPPEHVNFI